MIKHGYTPAILGTTMISSNLREMPPQADFDGDPATECANCPGLAKTSTRVLVFIVF